MCQARPTRIGVVVAIVQQATGINSVFFYAPMIFEQSGIGTDASFLQAVLVGLTNLVFTILAISCIDRFGRKPIMWGGLALYVVGAIGSISRRKQFRRAGPAGRGAPLEPVQEFFILHRVAVEVGLDEAGRHDDQDLGFFGPELGEGDPAAGFEDTEGLAEHLGLVR